MEHKTAGPNGESVSASPGASAEIPSAHLDPLPLLVQENVVKVALTKEVADAPAETV